AAGIRAAVVSLWGSGALLGAALHNSADALTAIPLWLAFRVGRRPPDRRFTYGYARSEDLAGIVVVVVIAASGVVAAWEAVARLAHPTTTHHVGAVALAAVVGVVANEAVARHRMTVGRALGSAALIADGRHARADSAVPLAALAAAGGLAL